EHRQAGFLIDGVRNVGNVLRSAKPVLRGEKLHQIHAGIARFLLPEKIDIRRSTFVDASLVRQQTDPLAANQIQAVAQQYRDARPHLCLSEVGGRIDLLADYNAGAADCRYRREQPMATPQTREAGSAAAMLQTREEGNA